MSLGLLLCGVLCLLPPTIASGQEGRPTQGVDIQGSSEAELRARWASKTPEERRLLRERFEAFKALGAEDARRLHERARRLSRLERGLRHELSEEDRRAIEALPPCEAEARWRERTREHLHRMGRSMRERLPPKLRRKLEEMPPGQRRAFLERRRSAERDERSRRVVRELGHEMGLGEAEVRRLEDLPVEARLREILGLERRRITARLETEGLPERLGDVHWRRLQSLGDEEFLRRVRPHLPHPRRHAGPGMPGGPGMKGPRFGSKPQGPPFRGRPEPGDERRRPRRQ